MAAVFCRLHAVYIAWVIFGALFTRGRPRLATLHVATLVYGVILEIFGFWCPSRRLKRGLRCWRRFGLSRPFRSALPRRSGVP